MKIVITGGAGFIGRRLAPLLLEAGHELTVIDRLSEAVHGSAPEVPAVLGPDTRFVRADIRDPDTWGVLSSAKPEVIVHLAAETGVGQSMYEVARYTDVNVQGTSVMLDAIRSHDVVVRHFVLASSRAVYGEGSYRCDRCGIVTPATRNAERLAAGLWEPVCPMCDGDVNGCATEESAPRRPTSVYAMTKAVQEDLLGIVAPTLGASVTTLRYSNVYGEGQPLSNPYTGVLSAFALRLMRGLAPKLYEDGAPVRDFVHVDDVARATALATGRDETATVNVGSGSGATLREVAATMVGAFGLHPDDIEVTGQYRIGDIRHFVADTGAARNLLGFEPEVDHVEGTERFRRWVEAEAVIPEHDAASVAEQELEERGLLGRA